MKSKEFVEKNSELLKEAKKCKSLEEFKALAKANNVEFEDITLDEAYLLLNSTDEGEISDDLLDNVAGGKGKKKTPPNSPTPTYPKSVGLESDDLGLLIAYE